MIETLPTQKSPGPRGPSGDFYQTYRASTPTLLDSSKKKKEEEGTLPNSFYEASSALVLKQRRIPEENYRPILQKLMQKFSAKYSHTKCESTFKGSYERMPRSSGVSPGMQGRFTAHVNRTKDVNRTIVSPDAETAFWGRFP